MASTKITIGPIQAISQDDIFTCQMNPEEIELDLYSVYAQSNVSLADYEGKYGKRRAYRWDYNEAPNLRFTTILDARHKPNNIPADQLAKRANEVADRNIKSELAKLRKMRQKDRRTGQPPELRVNIGDAGYNCVMKHCNIRIVAATPNLVPVAAEITFEFIVYDG